MLFKFPKRFGHSRLPGCFAAPHELRVAKRFRELPSLDHGSALSERQLDWSESLWMRQSLDVTCWMCAILEKTIEQTCQRSWRKIYRVLRAYSFIAAILASCKSCMFPEKGRLRCHWWLSGVPGANKSAAIPPARLVRQPWVSGVILNPKWLGCLCCAFVWWLLSGMSECRLVAPCQTSACWPLREGQ